MSTKRPRVAVLGEGEEARRWAEALGGAARVCSRPRRPIAEFDALVLAPGAPEPFARALEALQAGVPVLYAAPFALSPRQATLLHRLSERGPLLRFAERFRYRRGFAFLQRLLAGEEPFWRPLYLRTVRVAQPDGGARIDELAAEELATCQALLDGEPRQVTAVASRRDAVGDACAVFLTVQYSSGALAQCTVSLVEAAGARRLIAVTSDRTIILDDLDAAPVRIVGGPDEGSSSHGHVLAPRRACLEKRGGDPVAEEARRFLQAVSNGDRSFANSERWARVATLWWAARRSMCVGAPVEAPPGPALDDAKPPPFTVIRGGGTGGSRGRAALTLVG